MSKFPCQWLVCALLLSFLLLFFLLAHCFFFPVTSFLLIESTELLLIFLIPVFLLGHCYFLSCYFFSYLPTVSFFRSLYSYCYPNELLPFFSCFFFSHLSTVTFFPVTFFPTWNCYFLSCFFFSHLSTVTFFPVTFFPVTFFPTWNCYFLSCYLFSCYFLSVHRICHHKQTSQDEFAFVENLIMFISSYKKKYLFSGKVQIPKWAPFAPSGTANQIDRKSWNHHGQYWTLNPMAQKPWILVLHLSTVWDKMGTGI